MTIIEIISTSIATIFFLIVLSYYVLFFWKRKAEKKFSESELKKKTLSILIPAHNEETYLEKCVESVMNAYFSGKKEVIIIDDGSVDATLSVAKKMQKKYPSIILISHSQRGKAESINAGLKKCRGEFVAIIDGDSYIEPQSLEESVILFKDASVGAVCSIVKVANQKTFVGMWLHIEQLYNSLLRELFTKLNVNIVAPGPLSIYRVETLSRIGGFTSNGFAEDVDVALRMIKEGYRLSISTKAVSYTHMPTDPKWFYKQRTRFAKGWLNIFRRHFDQNFWRIYTLPLALFGYFQAVVMGVITLINLGSGYYTYFVSQGTYMSLGVLKFFFEWFSIIGLVRWFIDISMGVSPLTFFAIVSLGASLLSYPLYLLAIYFYEKRINLWHIVPLTFMFPFWFVIMMIYIVNIPEIFNANQRNIWTKKLQKRK
jgi:cellulose synthase/poly-beta-1,6-N-acetylglucosamine synthase-like glycosyltransferase